MRIRGGGGGAGSGSGVTSTAYVFGTGTQDIVAGNQDVVILDQFFKKPDTTTDYSYIADSGDGTPAIQINTQGLYLVSVSLPIKTSVAGDVLAALDHPPYNGTMPSPTNWQHPEQVDTLYSLNAGSMFFTKTGLPFDLLHVLFGNNTLGTVTVNSFSASMTIIRLGNSPG